MAGMLDSFELSWIVKTLVRLLLTAILTGAIGYERESVNQPAGFRTHTLVGISACLVMLTAEYLGASDTEPIQAELSRMGAAVVSGIGFLGAGTILREGTSIRGLTTAASVWTVACIGLAVGAGFISGAIAMTIITVVTLAFLIRFEPVQRSDEDCRRNGSRRRRPSSPARQSAGRAEPAGPPEGLEGPAEPSELPNESPEESPEGPAGNKPDESDASGAECLGVALDRDNHDILEVIRILDRNHVPVRAVRVLDASDPSGKTLHVCLVTGRMGAAARAGVISQLLRDRRIISILPDTESTRR